MKYMRLDNLMTIFFNQSYVLTTSIEKKNYIRKNHTLYTLIDLEKCLLLYIVLDLYSSNNLSR